MQAGPDKIQHRLVCGSGLAACVYYALPLRKLRAALEVRTMNEIRNEKNNTTRSAENCDRRSAQNCDRRSAQNCDNRSTQNSSRHSAQNCDR